MKHVQATAPLVAAFLVVAAAAGADASVLAPPAANGVAAATLTGVRDLGRATTQRVDVSVVLPYRHASDLEALIAAQRDPTSKTYRRFLTPAQFVAYFSPTDSAYRAVAENMRRAGFAVETSSNRTVLHAYGPASVADRYFRTTIDTVREASGRIAYANAAPAYVPAGLAGARIVGLDGVVRAGVAAKPRTQAIRPNVAGGPLFGPDGGFGPLAITKAEDFPLEHGYTGRNSNVADIIDGNIAGSDVSTFLKTFGVKQTGPRTTTRNVDGGCLSAGCFDAFTATLDAEWILAEAPGASLFTYQTPSLANGALVDAFNAVASDDAVNIVNFSIGACEVSGNDLELGIEPLIAQGAALGISYESVAFGGANLCGVPPLALPMAPANLDTVTAVGASSTFVDQTGKQSAESTFSNSNGGVSLVIPLPSWQAKTRGVSASGRNVPDIVIPGSVDGVGPSIYFGGTWAGGTAFVNNAPFAGYLATVQEMYGYTTPLGNVAPAMYATFDKYGYKDGTKSLFDDVMLGCIGAVGGKAVCAKSGYDISSGIGSISGGFLLAKSFGYGPIQPPTP